MSIIEAKDELVPLRTEILESEKAKIDLLKYKLITIAPLAAIGLGFRVQNSDTIVTYDYVLCVIPFVCAYIDLLCYHNILRILVIAGFLNYNDDPYEGYIKKLESMHKSGNARYFFNMEDFALQWSSIILSVLLILYSFISFYSETNIIKGSIFLFVGFITIIVSLLTKLSFKRHQKALFDTANEIKKHVNLPLDSTT